MDAQSKAIFDSIYGGAQAAAVQGTTSAALDMTKPTAKKSTPLQKEKPWLYKEKESFAGKHPVLNALGQGLKETVVQPARAARQIGQGLGNVASEKVGEALHPFFKNVADKLGISHEEALQAQKDLQGVGATDPVERAMKYDNQPIEPTRSIEQGAGQALQAGAYLASPMIGGAKAIGAQGAVLGAGRAMEKEKGPLAVAGEAALTGALSFGVSKAMTAAGGLVSKGTGFIKEKLTNLFTKTTNVPKVDIQWAQKPENAAMVANYFDDLAKATDSGDIPAAQAGVRVNLLSLGRTVIDKAKKAAEQTYDDAMKPLEQTYSTAITSKDVVLAQTDDVLTGVKAKFDGKGVFQGLRGKPEDDLLVKEALETINTHSGWNLAGLTELKRKLFVTLDAADEGSVANRVLSKIYGLVDGLQDDATSGATKEINSAYRAFKVDQKQLRPLWSEKVNADSALNFASNLSSTAKQGSAKALERMEVLAGASTGSLSKNLKAFRVANLLVRDKAIPGASRMIDIATHQGIAGAGGAIGAGLGSIAGPGAATAGGFAGYAAGSAVAARMSSPRVFGEALLNGALKAIPQASNPLREALGAVFQNPLFQQEVIRALEGLKNVKK